MPADAPGWRYDNLRRRYLPAVEGVLPPNPPPYTVPPGTPYPDWPRCGWPSGCTIGVKDTGQPRLCSPHQELVLAYGHDATPDEHSSAQHRWRPCTTCGARVMVHGMLHGLEEAAALAWLEDHPLTPAEPDPVGEHARQQAERVTAGVKVRADARQTSRDAAARALPGAGTQAGRVLRCIVDAGLQGVTDEQISDRLGMPLNTVRPRRLELIERELALDSGDTAPTASGAQATVWLATLAGVAAAERTDP